MAGVPRIVRKLMFLSLFWELTCIDSTHQSCILGVGAFVASSQMSVFPAHGSKPKAQEFGSNSNQRKSMLSRTYCVCRAPEQVDSEFGRPGPHTDVWGFAACLLHLAPAQLPYPHLTHHQLASAMIRRRPPEVPDTLPPWLQLVLQQCFSFDTLARPSVAHLLQVCQATPSLMSCPSLLVVFNTFTLPQPI